MWNRSKFIALAGILLTPGVLVPAAAPEGWFLAGGNPGNYDTGVDSQTRYGGQPSAFLKSTGAASEAKNNFGTLMQQFNVSKQYAGRRVRLSASVKSDSVRDWAGLWMRVDRKDKPGLSFDNMQNRAIKGTTPWQQYEVVLDVQSDATRIAFGILLSKSGTVWISGATFDVVDESVPVTNMLTPPPPGPRNLNFEK